MAVKKNRVSYTLSDDAVTLLQKIKAQLGLSAASTVEFIIREKANQLGITVD